jgi:anaerobic magnesium-protoporphyrin IX monomethyl ester cyclase
MRPASTMHEAAQAMACGGGKEQLVEQADDAPFEPAIMRESATPHEHRAR